MDNQYYALRPAEHVQGRTVHSFGGNVLVQQVRSSIGRDRNAELKQRLSTVELGTIDDACVVNADDETIFGHIQAAQYVLSVEKLSTFVPPGDFQMWVLKDGVLMYKEDYGLRHRPAEIVVVGNGEYLQAETANGHLAVMWSSNDSLLDAFAHIGDLLGAPSNSGEAAFLQLSVENGDGASGAGNLGDILDYVREENPPVAFVRVQFELGELLWSAPFARISKHAPTYAEIGLRLKSAPDKALIDPVILATASDELRGHLVDVESQIKQLVAA